MKKIIHYFLIIVTIVLVTSLVVSIFYARFIYRELIFANKSEFPSFIVKIINRLTPPTTVAPLKLKAEKTIHIPEGWTNQDIAKYLTTKGKWSSKKFLQITGSAQVGSVYMISASSSNFSRKFSFLKDRPKNASLEGYLFPDTYRIYASSSIKGIIFKMLDNFDDKLTAKMRADIKAQGKTIYNIITMASLIEKEAPINYHSNNNYNAKIIAGIFWNRLKNGQALESDATLSYILNDNQPQHKGLDLEIDSLYNTYRYRGLPPGPISNPGILAIEAAIYPIRSSYNYFLTPPGRKAVIYAKTYAEHLKNIYRYLK